MKIRFKFKRRKGLQRKYITPVILYEKIENFRFLHAIIWDFFLFTASWKSEKCFKIQRPYTLEDNVIKSNF